MALVPNENSPAQDSYHALLIEIKGRIHAAQNTALRAVISRRNGDRIGRGGGETG
jgi:hypothetical protein